MDTPTRKRAAIAWDGRGGYFEAKILKLHEQFEQDKSASSANALISDIFKGIVILIDGYTDPPAIELRRLMQQHGGGWRQYPDASVTHLVASQLSVAKARSLPPSAKVVRPTWITDSIKASRRLPITGYQLGLQRYALQPRIDTMIANMEGPCTSASSSSISPPSSGHSPHHLAPPLHSMASSNMPLNRSHSANSLSSLGCGDMSPNRLNLVCTASSSSIFRSGEHSVSAPAGHADTRSGTYTYSHTGSGSGASHQEFDFSHSNGSYSDSAPASPVQFSLGSTCETLTPSPLSIGPSICHSNPAQSLLYSEDLCGTTSTESHALQALPVENPSCELIDLETDEFPISMDSQSQSQLHSQPQIQIQRPRPASFSILESGTSSSFQGAPRQALLTNFFHAP